MTDDELIAIRDGFDARRDAAFESERGKPLVRIPKKPPQGPIRSPMVRQHTWSIIEFATRCYWLNEQLAEADDALIENAQTYLDGDYRDINPIIFHWHSEMLLRLINTYGPRGSIDPGRMSAAAETKCLQVCWAYCKVFSRLGYAEHKKSLTWDIYDSENHHSQRFSTAWHYAKLARHHPDFRDLRYDDGGTTAEHFDAWNAYLKVYCQERARKGLFIETHNDDYNTILLKGLYNCYDFGDETLRRRVGQLLDLYWATWAQEQIDGVEGGGRIRVYQGARSLTRFAEWDQQRLNWLLLGMGKAGPLPSPLMSAALSAYRLPLVVIDLALDVSGRGVYEVHQRPLGLSLPGSEGNRPNRIRSDHGGIHRYSYCTPEFIIGTPMVEARDHEEWSNISSQNRWEGVIFAGDQNARIVVQAEADNGFACYNATWSVQRRGALISQKLRTSDGAGAMRVWIAEASLSEPTVAAGWVFVEHEGAFVALRSVRGGFSWEIQREGDFTWERGPVGSGLVGSEPRPGGRWMVLEDEWSPVIVQVVRKEDVEDLAAFRSRVVAGEPVLDGDTLSFTSVYGDDFLFDMGQSGAPMIAGVPVDYGPVRAFDSPFVVGDWNSGVVRIGKDERELLLDFNS